MENLPQFESFYHEVQNKKPSEIKVISFGIEGQKGIQHVRFNGREFNVKSTVDGHFIEEHSCQSIEYNKDKDFGYYTLTGCAKGNEKITSPITLLSVPFIVERIFAKGKILDKKIEGNKQFVEVDIRTPKQYKKKSDSIWIEVREQSEWDQLTKNEIYTMRYGWKKGEDFVLLEASKSDE